ncbi:protein phosphatase 2C domain-containing protein [Streptomyces sp. NPDC059063]|uniref:protein phosphatase 2C domain-containing protein n=1 Tax=unclassified Streptomyces TaxID=2593676 RepID=UPI0036B21B27
MSQQGERHTGQKDDWWGQLYDEDKNDTGPAAAADTLDDRFASVAGTVGAAPGAADPYDIPDQRHVPTDELKPRPPISPPRPPAPPGGEPPDRAGAPSATASTPPGAPAPPPPQPPLPGPPGAAGAPGAVEESGSGRGEVTGVDSAEAGASAATGASPRAGTPAPPPPPPPTQAPASGQGGAPAPAGPGTPKPAPPEAPAPPGTGPSPRPGPPPLHPPAPPETPLPARGGVPAPSGPPAPTRPPAPPQRSAPSEPPTPRSTPPITPHPSPLTPRSPAPAYRAPAPWTPPTTPSGPVTFPAAAPGPGPVPGEGSSESSEAGVPDASVDEGAEQARLVPAYVGDGPPTYDAEPTGLPAADPDDLESLVADTALDGARYGTYTLRAVSVRGDSARYRGEPRRDALLTARFGTGDDALVLVAMATGARATAGAHRAAADACAWIGRAVGRSHARLAQDIRAARRGDLKSGLHRLTDRSLGKLRARAAELGLEPEEYTASLRCLLLPADPECRTRVFFGVGAGGLFRLRGGEWQDIEPRVAEATGAAVVGFGSPPSGGTASGTPSDAPSDAPSGTPSDTSAETPDGDRLTMDLGITTPPSPYEPAPAPPRDPFRFRASVARPGDTLLLCSGGLADPLRGEPDLTRHLTRRWAEGGPPGLAAFLADIQVRVKGYADDRTAAAVWEA